MIVPGLIFLCLLQDQDAEEFHTKVNDSSGDFELYIYEDAGHAFLTAESHRDSKISPCVPVPNTKGVYCCRGPHRLSSVCGTSHLSEGCQNPVNLQGLLNSVASLP